MPTIRGVAACKKPEKKCLRRKMCQLGFSPNLFRHEASHKAHLFFEYNTLEIESRDVNT